MTEIKITEWTLDGVLEEIINVHDKMKDRHYAFILGAGASKSSGIATGHELAQRWLEEIYHRECLDKSLPIEQWLASGASGFTDSMISFVDAGSHYSQIFERRFCGDEEAGYAALEDVIEGKIPSLGYSLLASIIEHTRHKVVITTNFDNLVADALSMQAHQSPLIVAHESLAGFVRPNMRRPLIAKIHRGLFFNPKNDHAGVSKMEESWKEALRKIFQHYTPIVIGYGGNDGSLMDMLYELPEGSIAGRIIWCCKNPAKLPQKAVDVLIKHKGITTRITGFDEFMLQLAEKFIRDFIVERIPETLERIGKNRAQGYREQIEKITLTSSDFSAKQIIIKSAESTDNWWGWQLRIENEKDKEIKNLMYEKAIISNPMSKEIYEKYASFLSNTIHDYDRAEKMYKKSLELDPTDEYTNGNYANFLNTIRKNYSKADFHYKVAFDKNPNYANNTANYACFLSTTYNNQKMAENLFSMSMNSLNEEPSHLINYANFLTEIKKDYDRADFFYQKAMELSPKDPFVSSNYANFLWFNKKNYAEANKLYLAAIKMDPENPTTTTNYALFLERNLKNYNLAEQFYRKSIDIDPTLTHSIVCYATFLHKIRKKFDESEELFKKAIELDPSDAQSISNYADLLENKLDFDEAERYRILAIDLSPNNENFYINYANFLFEIRKNYTRSEFFYKKSIDLNPNNPTCFANYAILLSDALLNLDLAETYYKKSIELSPNNENLIENYALFLSNNSIDYEKAETFYQKAIELDDNHRNCGNYAIFLGIIRKNIEKSEFYYRKAVDTEPNDIKNIANYSSLLVTKKDTLSLLSVEDNTKKIIRLSERKTSQELAEILFYAALASEILPDFAKKRFLSKLKNLITIGFERRSWSFEHLFEVVLPDLTNEKQKFYRTLGDAILDEAKVSEIEKFEDWKNCIEIDVFADF